MAKIDELTEQRIKDAAHIEDILTDGLGVVLSRDGANKQGLCPFHEDRHLGSFKVSPTKNICTCFSCGKSWNPIDALIEGKVVKDYGEALRWIAAKYGIYIANEKLPDVKPSPIREKAPELPMIYWPITIANSSLYHDDINPLLQYLKSFPFKAEDRARLDLMTQLYAVGTSLKGKTKGWTIWWQIDEESRVRTGHLMAYKADGHRDKTANHYVDKDGIDKYYSQNWAHSMMASAGAWDTTKYETKTCLFGLHLVDVFPKAEVCIVESEKSALICSAFTDPDKRLWLATAGKSGLTRDKLKPLIDRQRDIVLYPDKDGYNEWKAIAGMIGYNRLSISNKVNELWTIHDGPKADIADIMLRRQQGITESTADIASRRLGLQETNQPLSDLIDKLQLKLID